MNWEVKNTVLIGSYKCKKKNSKKKLPTAGFDLDDTIVRTKSKKTFSIDENDWILFSDNVTKKLKNISKTHNLIFITNQKGIKKPEKMETFKKKLDNIVEHLKLPITVYASIKDDLFRKPRIGIWSKYIGNVIENSFYCGDAAGRFDKKLKEKDFADTDRKFAINLGIKFYTPEEFFDEGKEEKYTLIYPNLKGLSKIKSDIFVPSSKQEVIINVGCPGSGKTHYTKNNMLKFKYVHINQDTLKTANACITALKKAMKDGNSAVIDNTNPSKDVRNKYLSIAKSFNVPCRCICFKVPRDIAHHRAWYRSWISGGKSKPIPMIVYHVFNKKYEDPTLKEGFTEILNVDPIKKLDKEEIYDYYNYYY